MTGTHFKNKLIVGGLVVTFSKKNIQKTYKEVVLVSRFISI